MRAALMENVLPEPQVIAQRFATPLGLGLQAASRISDRLSPDGMMALRSLVQQNNALDHRAIAADDRPAQISSLLRQITGFAGLVHENMYRTDGWRFLSLGISLERAAHMCTVLAVCTTGAAPAGALDLALEIGDSVNAHRARFQVWANAATVMDLLALDPQNPRSVRYHVTRAREHIAHLPHQGSGHVLSEVARLVLMAETRLATRLPDDLTADFLGQLRQDILDLSTALNDHHLV